MAIRKTSVTIFQWYSDYPDSFFFLSFFFLKADHLVEKKYAVMYQEAPVLLYTRNYSLILAISMENWQYFRSGRSHNKVIVFNSAKTCFVVIVDFPRLDDGFAIPGPDIGDDSEYKNVVQII